MCVCVYTRNTQTPAAAGARDHDGVTEFALPVTLDNELDAASS